MAERNKTGSIRMDHNEDSSYSSTPAIQSGYSPPSPSHRRKQRDSKRQRTSRYPGPGDYPPSRYTGPGDSPPSPSHRVEQRNPRLRTPRYTGPGDYPPSRYTGPGDSPPSPSHRVEQRNSKRLRTPRYTGPGDYPPSRYTGPGDFPPLLHRREQRNSKRVRTPRYTGPGDSPPSPSHRREQRDLKRVRTPRYTGPGDSPPSPSHRREQRDSKRVRNPRYTGPGDSPPSPSHQVEQSDLKRVRTPRYTGPGDSPPSPSHRRQQRDSKRQRRMNRKRDRQKMMNGANFGAASNVIELLDDDDDENDNINKVIDLSAMPTAIQYGNKKTSPIRYGEVLILKGPPDAIRNNTSDQRKPPPVASMPTAAINPSAAAAVDGTTSNFLRVLEIFPDADVDYVQKKLREQKNNFMIVVAVLSENNDYPRQKKGALDGTTNDNIKCKNNYNTNTIIRGTKSSEPMHDYSALTASFEISKQYRREAFDLLMYDFSFLKKNAVLSLLKQNNERYTLTRNHIHDMIIGKSPNDGAAAAAAAGSTAAAQLDQKEKENYQLLRSILVRGSFPKEIKHRMGNYYCLKKPRRKIGLPSPPITDPLLLDEHFHFEEKFQQWLRMVQNRLRGQAANKEALQNGTAVECGCCFDDVAVSECVPCKEKGHLFCKDCIVQYVESQVFGSGNLGIDKETKKPALEIKCCEGSGCNSGFPEEMLQKVLPPKTWEKYSEMQAKAQIEQAGLGENLAMCPKCGYQAEVPDTQNVFECPIDSCRFASCRKCGKASHIPLRCEEVVQKNRKNEGRLKIEEALSEAKMRTCPKCNSKFIKSDGCNKMTCACGMKMCYVCRQPLDKIKGSVYVHFCQVPHCDHSSCGKCRLYTNDEEDDAQAMREAGIAAKEAFVQQVQNEDGEATSNVGEDLQLDVDEMMADPSKPKAKKTKRRPENHFPRYPPQPQINNLNRRNHRPRHHYHAPPPLFPPDY